MSTIESPIVSATRPAYIKSRRRSTPSTATPLLRPSQSQSLIPSPIVALKRTVAVAKVEGQTRYSPSSALGLDSSHLYHPIRADLFRRLGHNADAVLAYEMAIARTRTRPSAASSSAAVRCSSRIETVCSFPASVALGINNVRYGLPAVQRAMDSVRSIRYAYRRPTRRSRSTGLRCKQSDWARIQRTP
jgi:hypothetical protein